MRTLHMLLSIGVLANLVLSSGCQPANAPPAKSANVESAKVKSEKGVPTSKAESPAKPAIEVAAEVRDWAGVEAWIAEQKGRVVVVDVWSTSCDPCLAEFSNFVALHKQYGKDVACASVNVDYYAAQKDPPPALQERVKKTLVRLAASMQNFIASDRDEDVFQVIEVAAIPTVLVYDREGKLHKKFSNDNQEFGERGFTYRDHIVPAVKELIATP